MSNIFSANIRPILQLAAAPAVIALALVLAPTTPATSAQPNVSESPLCQNYLTSAVATMQATEARLATLRGKQAADVCSLTRNHFLEVVKTRAVMAQCKSGTDRTQSVGKLDATIAQLDDEIASRCTTS
jgi:hypothetical protein